MAARRGTANRTPAGSLAGLGEPAGPSDVNPPAQAAVDPEQFQMSRSRAEMFTSFKEFTQSQAANAGAEATTDFAGPMAGASDTPPAPFVQSITRNINKVNMPTGSSVVPWNTEQSIERNSQQSCSIFGGHFEHASAVATFVGHLHMLVGGNQFTRLAGWN